jgi:predicted pyridoxine 5'-phosphate oxidase superfamily flavin-nucleotide-binding protein
MAYGFLERLSTPSVAAAREANGVGGLWETMEVDRPADRFTDGEIAFIAARDSFYLATVSQTGWPYIQHRGGPPGFLRVLDATTLGFCDYRGNRQFISVGNVAAEDRVALFLMDYPQRRRLKVLAHMTEHALKAEPELAARLATPGYRGLPERAFTLRLAAFDWNCAQHITPRFAAAEIDEATAPMRERLAWLEAENLRLRESPGAACDPKATP